MARNLSRVLAVAACVLAGACPAGARYRDGMSLYQYVHSAPPAGTDPRGTDMWYSSESNHAGFQVQVRNASGTCVLGCLRVDYHAQGFMEDNAARSSAKTVFGEVGRVDLAYNPGDDCSRSSRSPYKIKGTPAQDATLVDWSLKAAGQTRAWLGDLRLNRAWTFNAVDNDEGNWSNYVLLKRSCVDFTYKAATVFLGRRWLYRPGSGYGSFNSWSPTRLGEVYRTYFDAEGNYNPRADEEAEELDRRATSLDFVPV